jgi:hypothetical protein
MSVEQGLRVKHANQIRRPSALELGSVRILNVIIDVRKE